MKKIILGLLGFTLTAYGVSCKHEPFREPVQPEVEHGYPEEIARIIVNKCATAGCHNEASYEVSGGNLRLDSWSHLFNGGNTGAAVVPYSVECSPLLYFTNSFPQHGPIPEDGMKMPLNNPPLSEEEYLTLKNWVLSGAPDKDGNIPFASNKDTRQKIYLSHLSCDFITVIDAEKHVVMRCIPAGNQVTIEAAYSLKVAPDGFAYISYWASQYLFQLDTRTDSISSIIDLGMPNSQTLLPVANKELLLVNSFAGAIMRINTATKQVIQQYGLGQVVSPHGIAANRTRDTFFVTEQSGNIVHKIAANGWSKKITIDGQPPSASTGPQPVQIVMSPDFSRYFLSCQATQEVRVMDAYADTLIRSIPVGQMPQDLAVSRTLPYLFVTCVEDPATTPIYKGAVYIIDYNTLEVVRKVNDRYYMPHALAVDDVYKKLYVFSRNIDPDGPVPHHSSSTCDGRNGYYSVYDFEKLQPVNNRRYEVTVDPYAADARFK